ncbi:MAG: Hsp20/alpha crystallin family protein [Chloroflexi bacterium]|nr:Hsp20/alpha crystallin family protein [Chloroflexota bacterium]
MAEHGRSEEPRRRPRRGQPPQGDITIDLGFGELFKGLGNFLDLLGQMAEEGTSEVSRSGEVRGPGEVRGVYGFSVKMGLGGTPTVERFGNIHTTERGPTVSEVREPLVDVFDEGDHILVVAEIPGVAADDIHVEVEGDILTLRAEGPQRKYAKEVLLPALVAAASLRQSYQNGILEVRLEKAGTT